MSASAVARALMALAQVIFAGSVLQEFISGNHKAPVWLLAIGWLGLSATALWVEGVAEEVDD